ncbi:MULTISPECIES: hypothetical protein [Bacteroides]|uniref:Uncharacterized protein n=1 Tax=Bacteroides muris (ex Afrizal et al. 2022) TaxID=2516960 RepID=A0A4S2ALQ1_9BACE|nr:MULTISPECIES: hypothetical protein [Bacteroides]TGY01304.1 hypothetical protein E5355_15495 [Bacteroides muris (ex Afrizal et al. 2022)]
MKALKSQLAALDRKITADLAPTHEVPGDRMGANHETIANNTNGEETKPTAPHQQSANITPPQSTEQQEDKPSLVAESRYPYRFSTMHLTYHHLGS